MATRLCVLLITYGLLIAPTHGQSTPGDQSGATERSTGSQKLLALKYVGRWELKRFPLGDSNRNSLTVDRQSETEATGRFTSYRGSYGSWDPECDYRNAPFVMKRQGDARITMVVTHQRAKCGTRTFDFKVEPSGRLVHTSDDKSFSAYFDPGDAAAPFTPNARSPADSSPRPTASEQRSAPSNQASPSAPSSAPPAAVDSGAARRLRELEQLRKDGLITEREYEDKRKAVLQTL